MKVNIGPYPKGDGERIVDIQIDKYDTWSACDTIALIAAPLLRKLKDEKHGAPIVDDEEVPEHLRSNGKVDEDELEVTHFEKWDWVMDEMIWALENINTTSDIEVTWEEGPDHGKETENGNYVWDIRPSNDGTWERHRQDQKAIDKRVEQGLLLFGKYFRNLWD